MNQKLNLAKIKVDTAFSGINNKTSAFADEHKRSANKSSADIDDMTIPTEKCTP